MRRGLHVCPEFWRNLVLAWSWEFHIGASQVYFLDLSVFLRSLVQRTWSLVNGPVPCAHIGQTGQQWLRLGYFLANWSLLCVVTAFYSFLQQEGPRSFSKSLLYIVIFLNISVNIIRSRSQICVERNWLPSDRVDFRKWLCFIKIRCPLVVAWTRHFPLGLLSYSVSASKPIAFVQSKSWSSALLRIHVRLWYFILIWTRVLTVKSQLFFIIMGFCRRGRIRLHRLGILTVDRLDSCAIHVALTSLYRSLKRRSRLICIRGREISIHRFNA